MELTDQSGKEVELPKAEKDALVMAMSLHEKGRAAMKKANFELGLVLLLEASEEYDNCRAQILNSVDNYAILNLDIAWCYLRLLSFCKGFQKKMVLKVSFSFQDRQCF